MTSTCCHFSTTEEGVSEAGQASDICTISYTEFSPGYQQRTPERYFVGLLTLANVHFASCTYGSISENGDTANTTLTLQTLNGRTEADQVMLTKDSNSNWKISYLQGTSRG